MMILFYVPYLNRKYDDANKKHKSIIICKISLVLGEKWRKKIVLVLAVGTYMLAKEYKWKNLNGNPLHFEFEMIINIKDFFSTDLT